MDRRFTHIAVLVIALVMALTNTVIAPNTSKPSHTAIKVMAASLPSESGTMTVVDEPSPASAMTEKEPTSLLAREGEVEMAEKLIVPMDNESNTGFKSWMDYRVLTAKSSVQYALQQDAWTDEQGFRRYGDYYMVALGTYYSPTAGELFRITTEDGTSFIAVNGDVKSDADTDEYHQHINGNIVEFIVDKTAISRECSVMGDMSWAGFHGKIVSIEHIGSVVKDIIDR